MGLLFKLECFEVNLVLVLSVNGPLHMGLLFKLIQAGVF